MNSIKALCVVVMTSMLMPGCDCNNHNHGKEGIGELPKDTSGLMMMNDAMKENMERNLKNFQFALNDTDYYRHLSYYDQRMFRYDGLQLDTIAARYKKQYNMGQTYEVKNVLVNKISPLVEDSGYYWAGIGVYIQMDVHYDEDYPGDPKGLLGIVRDNFGPNVTYDSLLRVYHVDDNFVYYATTPKDTIDFKFLRGSFFRVPQLSKLAAFNTIATLKKYE
jgi:hypothetical protein